MHSIEDNNSPLKLNSASQVDIENAVFHWMELLSKEKYKEAYDLTWHDPSYQWTPALLESVIKGYGIPGETFEASFIVTPPETAQIESGRIRVYNDIMIFEKVQQHWQNLADLKVVGDVHYDLPINGYWSDLTVSFKILQGKDFFALELNDIHVL